MAVTVTDTRPSGEIVRIEPTWPGGPGEPAVTELLSTNLGAHSPFGDDVRFPLPVEVLRYEHATARPNR